VGLKNGIQPLEWEDLRSSLIAPRFRESWQRLIVTLAAAALLLASSFSFQRVGIPMTPRIRSWRSVLSGLASLSATEEPQPAYAVAPVTEALAACRRESTSAKSFFFG
jgi:hypothetical protein